MTSDDLELRDAVLAALRASGTDGASLDELARTLGLSDARPRLRSCLRRLSRTGAVNRLDRDLFVASDAAQALSGLLTLHQGGFWVAPDDGEPVAIGFDRLAGAIAGDQVEVVVDFDNGRGARAGGVARIITPVPREVTLKIARSRGLWVGTSRELGEPVYLTDVPRDAERGTSIDVVLDGRRQEVRRGAILPRFALIVAGPPEARAPLKAREAYAQVSGDERNATRLLDQLAAGVGVDGPFSPAAIAIADAARAPARADEGEDLTSTALVTIDGETARDFDDAVYAEALGDELRLVVCVADVSHYVPEDSALDLEARERGCSVYLPGRVYPMLPPNLSDDICSLRPHELRRCAWVSLIIDRNGDIEEYDVGFGVMRSHARLTYAQVQGFLDGGALDVDDEVASSLRCLDDARHRLNKRRQRRGMLDLDLPEPVITLTDDGAAVHHVMPNPRLNAHRLIEECMLAANETVADYLESRALPAIRRVHEDPNYDRVQSLKPVAEHLGVTLSFSDEPTIDEIDALIASFDGDPRGRVLSFLVLRAMAKATYAVDDRPHFGIGARRYLHFTSPIRRYPDLEVHRMLRRALAHVAPTRSQRNDWRRRLEASAALANTGEERATKAERFAGRLLGARYMADHIGESYPAIITDVAPFGMFISVEVPWVSGLVPVARIGDEFYEYDESVQCFTGRRTGTRFSIGDELQVRCVSVDIGEGRVTFERVLADGTSGSGDRRRDARSQRGASGGSRSGGSKQGGSKQGGAKPARGSKQGDSKPARDAKQGDAKPARGSKQGGSKQDDAKPARGSKQGSSKSGGAKRPARPRGPRA